jgi:hypothetical protein
MQRSENLFKILAQPGGVVDERSLRDISKLHGLFNDDKQANNEIVARSIHEPPSHTRRSVDDQTAIRKKLKEM